MPALQTYVLSLAAGVLVGAIYGLINVRSPAPPVVALVGLLGILIGEQAVPIAKALAHWQRGALANTARGCTQHVFGQLPGHGSISTPVQDPATEPHT